MNTILTPAYLLPIGLIVVQSFLILFLCIHGLKKSKIISTPLAGIEYSQSIVAAAFLLGVFLITLSLIGPTFHTFQTYRSQSGNTFKPFIKRFSQFFIIMLFFQVIYILMSWLVARLILSGSKANSEIEAGNIPFSILLSACILGSAITCKLLVAQFVDLITPHFINFR